MPGTNNSGIPCNRHSWWGKEMELQGPEEERERKEKIRVENAAE